MTQQDFTGIPDIMEKIRSDFGGHAAAAVNIISEGISQHPYLADPRIIRCIIYLAHKDLDALSQYISNAAVDPRDVMLWAEYTREGDQHLRLRDFNKTFSEAENNVRP